MAENLTVTLSAQDNISPALMRIAAMSTAAMDSIAQMGNTGGSAMDSIANAMRSTLDALNAASRGAADWAEADRLASQAAEQLHMSIEATPESAQKLADSMRESEEAINALSKGQQEAVRANDDYQAALREAQEATSAQQEAFLAAEQAAKEYDDAMRAGVSSTAELEAMAEQAMHAGEDLAAVNGRAAEAADRLRNASTSWAEADRLASQGAKQLHRSIEAMPNAAQKLADAMRESEEAINALSEEQQEAVRANDDYQDALRKAEEATSAQQEAFLAAEQAAKAYDDAMRAGVSSAAELEAMAEQAMHAGEDLAAANGRAAEAADRLRDATAEAADDVGDLGEEAEETEESVEGLADQVQNLLEAFGLAVGLSEFIAYLDECVQKSAEFEEALAKISTIADTSRVGMDEIKQSITDLSAETGDSVAALSEATYQAISAGVDTASAVEFVGQASQLAAAGFTEQATAVDILSTAINAYGLEVSEAEHISDMLIVTQNQGKTTVNELASSMGKVIPLAAAYGVEMDNLATGYAELTKGGIATAEATTYMKGMFNELGSATSEVSHILQEMTGSTFAELMEQGASLGDVMEILGDSVGGNATAFANLWSSQEAGVGALALYNSGAQQFNSTLSQMQSSAGATASAYDTMNDTMNDAFEDMENSFNNLGIAIGDALMPMVSMGVGFITNIIGGLGQFVGACPSVTAGIIGIATALGVAQLAIKAFNLELSLTSGPIGWIIAAISGVVILCTALSDAVDENVKKYNKATATSRQYADEMNALQKEYDELVDAVGEEAAAQSELAAELEVARAAYEGTYQSMDDFIAQCDAVVESTDKLSASIGQQMAEVSNQGTLAQTYISKLTQIGSKSEQTAADTQLMTVMYGRLKEIYPNLSASMEDFIGASDDTVAAIEAQAEAMGLLAQVDTYTQIYSDATEGMADLEVQIEAVQREMKLLDQQMDNADGWNIGELRSQYGDLEDRLDTLLGQHKELEGKADAAYDMASRSAEEYAEAQERVKQAALDAVSAMDEEDAAAAIASATYQALSDEIMDVARQHDELAQSISDAVDSQISSFKRFEADSSQSIAGATANIQASIQTMQAQTENVSDVHDYLVSQMHYTEDAAQRIMSDMIQPTAEGAGLATDAAQLVHGAMEGSAADAEAFSQYATTMLQKGQEVEQYGQTMADVADDMTGKMEEITKIGEDVIMSLDGLPEGVKGKADEAFKGFIQAITDADGPATQAAETVGDNAGKQAAAALAKSGKDCQEVMSGICTQIEQTAAACHPEIVVKVNTSAIDAANAQINALNNRSVGPSAAGVGGNALGTTHAENMFIAGESGPELIIGQEGSTVIPAAETRDILRGIGDLAEVLEARMGLSMDDILPDASTQTAPLDLAKLAIPESPSLDLSRFAPPERPQASPFDLDGFIPPSREGAQRMDVPREEPGETRRSGTFTININGTGELRVDSRVRPEDVVNMMQENLRPMLLDIVKAEVYEEGAGSYAF